MRVRSARADRRLPAHIRLLLAANLLSSVGTGLTMPFLLVYLHSVRHLSLGVAGVVMGVTAIVGIPAGPLMGALLDRIGPRPVCALALGITAVGTAGLIAVHDVASAFVALLVYGFGQSAVWPTWNALFAVLVPDESVRPRVFARGFQLLNLGLGLGALLAGALVHVTHPASFTVIYLVDALSYLAVIAVLALVPAGGSLPPVAAPSPGAAGDAAGYRAIFGDRRFRRYLIASCFLAFAGYSAINAGLVGYATHVLHSSTAVIAWAFGLNTGLIVLLQPAGLRLVHRVRRTSALMGCAALFGASWGVLWLGGTLARAGLANACVIAMFGIFSLGEVLLAPVAGPLVTMLAAPATQGRYNATASSVYTSLNVVGPAIAGVLLANGLGGFYLVVLMASAAVAVVAFARLRHVLSPAIDNVSSVGIPAAPS